METITEDRAALIEITKKKGGMKISVNGAIENACRSRSSQGCAGAREVSRLYARGREAWMKGDFETVSEMFGLLV
jgi:hypothetical protein